MTDWRRHKKEAEALCRRILASGLPADAELIYSGRNRLYAIPLKCGVSANVKVFKQPGALRGIIYGALARPKSLKSFVNAEKLLSLGISTPVPLAHLEERVWKGIRLTRSLYVCVHDAEAEEIRCWELREDRDELVEALGRRWPGSPLPVYCSAISRRECPAETRQRRLLPLSM